MPKQMKRFFLYMIFFGLVILAGCDMIRDIFSTAPQVPKVQAKGAEQTSAPVLGTVLARVNDAVITLENFDEKVKAVEMATAQLGTDSGIDTSDAKKNFLNDLVMQELFVQEARARGIDKLKDVRDKIEESGKAILANQVVMDETKGIVVDSSEIESFYNRFQKQFASPEEIKVREIVVSSEATAKEILIGLLQGGDFAAVARERSIASSASKGGDVGVVKKGGKFEKYDEVISTLEQGQVSQFFKGPDGFYIVKVDEKKGGTVPPLTEVFEQIKAGLTQQRVAERIKALADKLKREAKIEVKEDLLR